MISAALQRKREREAKARAEAEEKRLAAKNGSNSDGRLLRIYGKTRDEMVEAAQDRCDEYLMRSSSQLPPPRVALLGDHTFRTRDRSKELTADGRVSAQSYVPRAVYKGGGLLDREATERLRRRRPVVDAAQPRAATPSVVDYGAIRGRLEHGPYKGPVEGIGLRTVEKSKHREHHMRWGSTTEVERVTEELRKRDTGDPGEWEASVQFPVWRPVDKRRWMGGTFLLAHRQARPQDGESMTGEQGGLTLRADGPYIRLDDLTLRHRVRDKEMDGDFIGAVPTDRVVKSKGKVNFNYELQPMTEPVQGRVFHASIRGRTVVRGP